MAKKESFEDNLKQLEELVSKLESRDIPLEDAIEAYKKGLDLSKRCYEIFKTTEDLIVKKVEEDIVDFNQE
ncbi:MAG: exodeoxyribonuclease VII small subunit [bacterium]